MLHTHTHTLVSLYPVEKLNHITTDEMEGFAPSLLPEHVLYLLHCLVPVLRKMSSR